MIKIILLCFKIKPFFKLKIIKLTKINFVQIELIFKLIICFTTI